MSGLGRWLALVPGLIFVTSAYYIVLVYVRGDWPEFTGVSMIPLLVAASVSVLRSERLRLGPAFALAGSAILFFGAHNITILLGLTTLALTGLAVLLCVPDARRQLTLRGIVRVLGVVVPAALVSAWYLLPALAYESRTHIGSNYVGKQEVLREHAGLVSFGHLFTFSRASAIATSTSPYPFALSLPVLAIAWVLLGVVILPWGSRSRAWARLLAICSAMAILLTVVMTHVGLVLALPRVFWTMQFTYRLESYVLLELSGAILAALVLARGGSRHSGSVRVRAWTWLAVPVCVVSCVAAIEQLTVYPDPGEDRYAALKSFAEFGGSSNGDYQDVSERVVDGRGLLTLEIPLSAIHDGRASGSVRARAGTLVATNIAAGAYLLHVTGAQPVGLDSLTDRMVLRVGSGDGAGAHSANEARESSGAAPVESITISTGENLPIVLGRFLTLGGLAVLVLELLVVPAARGLVGRVRVLPRRTASTAQQPADAPSRGVPTSRCP
jgi:hypothetical protein